jgi:hypothetical protein
VSKDLLDNLRRDAGLKRQRRPGVAEVVDPDPGEASLRAWRSKVRENQSGCSGTPSSRVNTNRWRFTTTTDAQGQQQQTFLTTPRFMADAVLLPDGTVAIVAGAGRGKADDSGVPVMWVESYDPESEMFIGMSALSVPRLYHSTALLLPDGSVLIAGSTGGRFHYTLGGGSADEFRLEVYHPPYLFRARHLGFNLAGRAFATGSH